MLYTHRSLLWEVFPPPAKKVEVSSSGCDWSDFSEEGAETEAVLDSD